MFNYVWSLLIIFLEIFCCKIFFETFGEKRNEKKSWRGFAVVLFLSAGVLLTAVFLYRHFLLKELFIISLTALVMIWYLRIGFVKSLILSFLYQGLLLVVDYFDLLINMALFQNVKEIMESHAGQASLIIVMGKVILLLVVLLIQRVMSRILKAETVEEGWFRFIFFPVFTMVIITAILYSSDNFMAQEYEDVFFVVACGLAGMNVVVFYLLHDIVKHEAEIREDRIYRLKAENQMRMYRSISENFNKQQKRSHEYKNQILCMESLVKKKQYDALESYINGIGEQINKELDAIRTHHVIVDSVLNTKYQEMKEKGIVFVFVINDLSHLSMDDTDIVVILSNLLDNAVEACEKCVGEKVIKLKFVMEDDGIILSVRNTYKNEIRYENGKLRTTKTVNPDEHGIGIGNIIETIEKYGGSYAITHDGKEFYFSLMMTGVS